MSKLLFKLLLVGLLVGVSQSSYAQTVASPSYDFDFQLVGVDAQTKGAITANTTQVELGVFINNHSKNIIPGTGVEFSFSEGYLRNGRGLQLQSLETNNGLLTSSGLSTIERAFIFSNVSPTVLTSRIPRDVVLAHLKIKATIYPADGSPKVEIEKTTEDVVYQFSNDELIPSIINLLQRRILSTSYMSAT